MPTNPIFSGQRQQRPLELTAKRDQEHTSFGPTAGGGLGIFPLLRVLEQEAVAASCGLTGLFKNTAKHFIPPGFIFLNSCL